MSDASEGGITSTNAQRATRTLVAIGAAIRIGSWLTKWNEPVGIYDSWYYSEQARQLTQGKLFRELLVDVPSAEHGPLTSLLMAPVSWGDDFVRWQRLVTVVCGITLVWLLGRIGRRLGGAAMGVFAAGIAAFSPVLWISDGLVMSESIGMLSVAVVLECALLAVDDFRRRPMLLLGVALGLAALARSELLLLVPGVLAWLAFSRHRRDAASWGTAARSVLPGLATAAVVLMPWVAFNLARFEEPVLLTSNEATTLLGANCFESYSPAGPHAGGWSLHCVVSDPDYRYGEEPSVRSKRQRSLALEYVRDHLAEVPRVLVARVLRTLDVYAIEDMITVDVSEGRLRWLAWSAVVTFWLTASMAVVGAKLMARRERGLLLLPVLLVLLTTVVFYGGHRIRSPAEPSLVVFAACGLTHLQVWSRARRSKSTAITSMVNASIPGS